MSISEFNIEYHPFETTIANNAEILIIGTFPSYNLNRNYKFYYSSNGNLFWEILSSIYKYKFIYACGDDAVNERKRFLEAKKIGITDMHEICYRKEKSSSDNDLHVIKLTDIFGLLRDHSNVKKIILTSRTEIFGALGLLKTYFIQQNCVFPETRKRYDKIIEANYKFEGRDIKILVPYSPSTRVVKSNKNITKNQIISMYNSCLVSD